MDTIIEKSISLSEEYTSLLKKYGNPLEVATIPTGKEQEIQQGVFEKRTKLSRKLTKANMKAKVQAFILAHPEMDKKVMAETLGVPTNVIGGNKVALMKAGKLDKNHKVIVDFVDTLLSDSKWAGRKRKNEARKIIIKFIYDSLLHDGTILGLPAEDAILEIMIFNQISKFFHFDACEVNPEVYAKLRLTAEKFDLKMFLHLGLISDRLYQARESEYSHIILDYCATFPTVQSEVEYTLKNNLVKVGGIIAITLCTRYNVKGYNTYKEFKALVKKYDNYEWVSICKTGKEKKCFSYAEPKTETDPKGAPMGLFILKRIK